MKSDTHSDNQETFSPDAVREAFEKEMGISRKVLGEEKTQSHYDVKECYGPEDIRDIDYEQDIGRPGIFPYTRGAYPRMYREKLWVRGAIPGGVMYAEDQGLDLLEELMKLEEMGIVEGAVRTSGDFHNLATVDPDHPLVKYDIGNCAGTRYSLWQFYHGRIAKVAQRYMGRGDKGFILEIGHAVGTADSLEYALILAYLETEGRDISNIRGNMVNDPLHVHIHNCQKYEQPLEVGWRISTDAMEFSTRHTPKFRPTNGGCAYDLRESGINTVQELAFRFGNYIEYCDEMVRRSIPFEKFGPRPAIALSGEIDFFETICKLRAARKIWAQLAKNRYGADPTTVKCPPCNTNLAGNSMTQNQPVLNIVRTTIEALASVLGGVNGMELKAYTEPISPPPNEAVVINKGIESIIAEETGVPLVADPLGGSYYVEWLTRRIEEDTLALLSKILDMGGMRAAIRKGWPQQEVEKAALERQRELEERRRIKVAENAYHMLNEVPVKLPLLEYKRPTTAEPFSRKQKGEIEDWNRFVSERDLSRVKGPLKNLYHATRNGDNIIRPVMEAFKAYASIGEIMGVVREALGFPYDQFKMVRRPDHISYD
jgi:methylmalonyl-CoA mutase N-terminal domain/subunit